MNNIQFNIDIFLINYNAEKNNWSLQFMIIKGCL